MKKELLIILGLFPSLIFGQTIGAYILPTEFKEFMSHNLGADMNLPPLTPSKGIHGAKYQWGYKNPMLTQDQDQANIKVVAGWNTNAAPNDSWIDGIKTINDPCPVGFRIPSSSEWEGVINNNVKTNVGTWGYDAANYVNGIFLGNSLFLPSSGLREYNTGILNGGRGSGYYISSTRPSSSVLRSLYFTQNNIEVGHLAIGYGFSVRCISENSMTLSTNDIQPKNKDLGFHLYPNPVKTELFIEGKNSEKDLRNVKVEIYDFTGKLYKIQKVKQKFLMNHLSDGIYIVKIITADGTQAEKIIVKNNL